MDLLVDFAPGDLSLTSDDTQAVLQGGTTDGTTFVGTDSIQISN